jgi:hypothetical protein
MRKHWISSTAREWDHPREKCRSSGVKMWNHSTQSMGRRECKDHVSGRWESGSIMMGKGESSKVRF